MSWRRREHGELELSTELTAALGKLRAKSPVCPRPEMLQAARSEVLPPEVAEDVKQHLQGCRLCQSVVTDLEALDSADFDAARHTRIWKRVQTALSGQNEAATVPAPWKLWLRPVPLAALGFAVIVLAVGIQFLRDRRAPSTTTVLNHVPALPQAPSALRLEKAPIVLPASAVVVWRGAEDAKSREIKALKLALAPYEANNYTDATQRLDRLRKKYPRMAEAPFYLGVCQLFLNENEDAVRSLKDAANFASAPLKDEAAWYLALAEYRSGKADRAIGLLQPLCQAGGKNSSRACAGIKELETRR